MSRCALCGNGCIPMADYDLPICAPCDAHREDQAMRQFSKRLPAWAAKLPLSYRTGPGDPAAIAELMTAFRMPHGPSLGVQSCHWKRNGGHRLMTAAHTLPPILRTNRGTASVSHPPVDTAPSAVAARVRPDTPATETPDRPYTAC